MAVSSSDGRRIALAFALSACSVGQGTGEVTGSVNIPQCDLATESFSLDPSFYAASPFEDQLTIRIQNGGDYPLDSDGLSIVVLDATSQSGRVGTPIPISGEEGAPVSMSLYLNDTCPTTREELPVFLEAQEGSITFDSIYAPEADENQRETSGSFQNVRFTDSNPPEGEAPRSAVLSGSFRFLFERGRPGQPFP